MNDPPPTVLVVDDEPGVRQSLRDALELEGFRVRAVDNGLQALMTLGEEPADAVVLDVAMPLVDGLEACRRLRASGSRVPVLMLTARDAVDDRVAGLEAGADDYLPKPFALRELVARLRAIMRRSLPDTALAGDELRYADLRLDRAAHRAWRVERLLELTRTEYLLLECFLEHPEQVLERSQILLRVWGYDFGSDSNSLGVYIGYLRRKLEAGGEPRLLQTVRSVGYVLRLDP
ncbi:MAG TPA: response regulator transcription factor [Capillimicrobium sp.]|jgi:two-component system response regulator MprA